MTIERALDIGVVAASTTGAAEVVLSQGTRMDQWVMWGISSLLGMAAAYGTFRLTTEHRLTALETLAKDAASHGVTAQQYAVLQGQLSVVASEQAHRKEMFERMDRRLEQIAQRVGVA